MPFQGLTMSSLFIHLLIPPKKERKHEVHIPLKHIKIISTHWRVLQLHGWAQLTPSPKHLFPPKGEWCFTPILHIKTTWTKQDSRKKSHKTSHIHHTYNKILHKTTSTPYQIYNAMKKQHIKSTMQWRNTMDHGYQPHSKQWKMKFVVELLILFLQTLNVSKVREWVSGLLILPFL